MASMLSTIQQHWQCCRTASSCATGAQHQPSGLECAERLPSTHARSSDAGDCREAAAACLHKQSCRGCSWRNCTPAVHPRGQLCTSQLHAAHLVPLLSNACVFCYRTKTVPSPVTRARTPVRSASASRPSRHSYALPEITPRLCNPNPVSVRVLRYIQHKELRFKP